MLLSATELICLVAAYSIEEDVDKLAAGNRLGHLLVAELLVALVKDALADAVVDVGFVPVASAVGQRDLAVLDHLMQRGGQLDGFSDGQRALRLIVVAVTPLIRPFSQAPLTAS